MRNYKNKIIDSEKDTNSERVSVQKLIEKLNKNLKNDYDPFMWSCHELKVDGYPSEYKWVYCILKSTMSREIKRLTGIISFLILFRHS